MRDLIKYQVKEIIKLLDPRNFILHPFLLIIYPIIIKFIVIGLEVEFEQLIRPLVIALLISSILLIILYRLLHDWDRAGILSTLLIIFFFYFGIAFNGLHDKVFSQSKLFQPYSFIYFWTAIFGVLVYIIWKARLQYKKIFTLWLNITALIVLAQLIPFTYFKIQEYYRFPFAEWQPTSHFQTPIIEISDLPDIFYFILDGYGREDTLSEIFNYSNQEFIMELQDRGFYVTEQSNANFVQTALSIASSLNMDYLDDLHEFSEDSKNRLILKSMISDSQIREILNLYNYELITFNTGYNLTKIENADIYYDKYLRLNYIEEVTLSNSVLLLLDNYSKNILPLATHETHRNRIRFALDQIQEIPKIDGPTFTIAHLMIPHPPFVFDKTGSPVSPDWSYSIHDANLFPGTRSDYISGYINKIEYINSRLLPLIDTLINDSDSPPIIIIQGDHGSRMLLEWESDEGNCFREAGSIFNAYFLPGNNYSSLYPTISPVNSFRMVLNEYFSQNLPYLEDKTYFSNFSQPFNFQDVTDEVSERCSLKEIQ